MVELKDVFGYEGIYTIDSNGNVYSKNGRKRKTRINRSGYNCIILTKNNKQYNTFVHRLVALSFISNPENKAEVNHKDGDKLNNSIDNLEWMTTKENAQHSWDTGLKGYWNSNKNGKLSGEGNGMCKISDSEVLFIRKNYNGNYGEIECLAKEYGVRRETISALLNNKYRRLII